MSNKQTTQDDDDVVGLEIGSDYTSRYAPIRQLVRTCYAVQDLRVQVGNRVCAVFRLRAGMTNEPKIIPKEGEEGELDAQYKKLMVELKADYQRVTDGIVAEGDAAIDSLVSRNKKLPAPKRFKPQGHLQTYADLLLVDQYIDILSTETDAFKNLKKALDGIPIYDEFLSKVDGIGPALAGMILSEIDITKAQYPSSLHVYAGLDVVYVGVYTDDKGVEHVLKPYEIDTFYETHDTDVEFLAEGKYKIRYEMRGRSNKEWALVDREYKAADGTIKTRKSITYNPKLKTKLVGVAMSSFLKRNYFLVDGEKMTKKDRLALAMKEGLELNDIEDVETQVTNCLRLHHKVEKMMSPYAKAYYDYRVRLNNRDNADLDRLEYEFTHNPEYRGWTEEMKEEQRKKIRHTENHKHRMACRFAIKLFLNDLYRVWRKLEGLFVNPTYEEVKLGKAHRKDGVMGIPAPRFYNPEYERTHRQFQEPV